MPQLPISDEYFNRSAAAVTDTEFFNKRVRYCVFARKPGLLCGLNRAVAFVDQQCLGPLKITAAADGDEFAARQAVMIIEGLFGELVNLETTYLGMLAFSGAAASMSRVVAAAGPAPVIDMAARHYPWEIIEQTAYAAAIGGAAGTSTLAGQRYVLKWLGADKNGEGNDKGSPGGSSVGPPCPRRETIRIGNRPPSPFKLYGSIPHALNAVYGGSSIEAAKAYHRKFPEIPLTVLIDFEGRELDVCREAVQVFGDKLHAVRLDTHGGRIHQGGHAQPVEALVQRIFSSLGSSSPAATQAARAALERYGFGPGVTIEGAYNVRQALDDAGASHTQIVLSSGFTAEKVAAFRACNAPMDAVGTGGWLEFLVFTSDITHVFENGRWIDRCKSGRAAEIAVPELPVRIDRC